MKTKKQSQKQVTTQLQVYLPIVTLTEKDMSSVNGGGQINTI
jgi:bacteriocin-like protein